MLAAITKGSFPVADVETERKCICIIRTSLQVSEMFELFCIFYTPQTCFVDNCVLHVEYLHLYYFSCVYKCVCNQFAERLFDDLRKFINAYLYELCEEIKVSYSYSLKVGSYANAVNYLKPFDAKLKAIGCCLLE